MMWHGPHPLERTSRRGGLSIFVGSDLFRTSSHAAGHPLAIPRVSLVTDLCQALGWLPDGSYVESPMASAAELARFHDPAYIAAVLRAEADQTVADPVRRRFNLGVNGNAVHPALFRRPATACGASLWAARQLLVTPGVVYSPAGGNHHGQAGRASGFCVFNDIVLAILAFLDGGLRRIAYVDLDAHFGDGVQHAFARDDRVFTLSIHEEGRWPMARGAGRNGPDGGIDDRAGGTARNLPVPAGFNDDELEYLMEAAVLPLIQGLAPEAVVVQAGADALDDDPLSRLALSNNGLWRAIHLLRDLAPRLLVLGGGGYNPWTVARCWAGVWAGLAGFDRPERLPEDAIRLLRSVSWRPRRGQVRPEWFDTLADAPRRGLLRPEVREVAARALAP